MLSNGWILPYIEVINWHLAVIWFDEELITQVFKKILILLSNFNFQNYRCLPF